MCTLNKIIKLLEEKGKTQKDLTDYLGISKNTFTNWKNGLSSSYTKYINKISEYLGVTTDYLLSNSNNKKINDNDIKFALFGGEEGITDEMFAKVKEFAKFVKETERGKKNDGK